MPTLFWIAILAIVSISHLVSLYRRSELQKELKQMTAVNQKLEEKNYELEMQLFSMKISMDGQKSTLTKLKEMVDKLSPKSKEEKPVDSQGFKVTKGKTATTTRQATSSSHRADRVTDNSIYVADPMSPLNPLSPSYQKPHTMRDDTPVHSSHRHDDTPSYSSSVCSDTSSHRSSGYDSSYSYDSGSSSDSGSSGGGCD